MAINTKKAAGRRSVHYNNLEDLQADAQQLVSSGSVKMVGNWSLGQVLGHLATTMNASIDGFPMMLPWPVRAMMRVLMKKKMLTQITSPGYSIPGKAVAMFVPKDGIDPAQALEQLCSAVDRQHKESKRSTNPVLGRLTNEQWLQFHLRHAELHMSFAVVN